MSKDISGLNNICKEHLAYRSRLETLEDAVKALWKKWDRIQLTAYGILVALISNLIAVIVMIAKVS